MLTAMQNFDRAILNFINSNFHGFMLDEAMVIITYLGNAGIIWIVISMILLITTRYRKIGIMALCALILSWIFVDVVLKNLVQRPRPFVDVPTIKLLISKPLSYSFPSGHTASAFAAVGILMKMMRRYKFYVLTLALLIAFSRVYLFVHYPTDIIGGIIVGLISSKIVFYFFKPSSQRLNSNQVGKGATGLDL